MFQTRIIKKQLHFKQPAGTSRGVYTTRDVWYILLTDTGSRHYGVGECAPLPALSCDDIPSYDEVLATACKNLEKNGEIDREALLPYPSILFGMETALLHFRARSLQFWHTPFSKGKEGIPINGLIWMGNFDEMYRRIGEKMQQGFRCIKLKIGAIDFEKELELLAHIRRHFTPAQIELRVDANGAFSPADALEKLHRLSEFQLHSIEQPIRAGQWNEMARLCAATPFPIALDEELIGINRRDRKIELLETIRPQYIILKPSLHGGISGSEEWMELAAERGIGSWVTSALESNIGLNAIAQWCATLQPALPQGLGTGLLFTDNIDYPLHIEGGLPLVPPRRTRTRLTKLAETMTKFCTNRNKQTILIESIPYSNWEIEMVRMNIPADNRSFRQELFSFLSEWFDPADTLPVHTSGSTGKPKELYVEKERMMESACLTCSFLGLQKEDSALLCMPLQYIAGKMVVIRALVAGLDLLPVTPSGHPLKDLTKAPVFAAMIPMQVYNSLQVPEEKAILQQIRHLIIGGGPIDSQLNAALKDFPHAVWSTYGMTETLSHIALRRLNGPEASDWYTPFESIQIRLSKENTLVIYAPEICEKELVTNDIAEINGQNQFRILGRKDNTINTGGVKVQIEQVEAALKEHLSVPFLITSAPDEKFGEIIVLLAEGQLPDDIEQTCTHQLPPYWRPKRFVPVFKLPLTETGKPDRAIAKLLAQK